MGVVDEVDRLAMVAAGKSRTEGIKNVLTAIPDPPQVGGVKAAPEAGKQRPTRNVCTMIKRATEKESAGRSMLIRTDPDPARLAKRTGNTRITQKDQEDLKPEKPVKGQP